MAWSTVPANDAFADRTPLKNSSAVVSSYISGATVEPDEPPHGGGRITGSLWWTWTAPETGWANFSTFGSSRSLAIAIYIGDSLGTLSAVGVNNVQAIPDSALRTDSVSVPVEAGQTYQIAIASPADSPAPATDRVVLGINQRPTILSNALVRGTQGAPLSYEISATNGPMRYAATDLPPGMTVNRITGVVRGTPTAPGSFDATISATGPGGVTSAVVRFEIGTQVAVAEPPKFLSGDAVVFGYVGSNIDGLYYSINPEAAGFSADRVPPGLAAALSPGGTYVRIFGTPTTAGVFQTSLRATNAGGADEGVTTFQIFETPPTPLFDSAAVAYGTVGESFTYTFRHQPVQNDTRVPIYSVGELPPGLNFDGASIRGTPAAAGTFAIPVELENAGGRTAATLTLVVAENDASPPPSETPPVITSPAAALATSGIPFSYSVSTDSTAASYSASGLPPGITINPVTGALSGTPARSGRYTVEISATNAHGTTTTPLSLAIRAPRPPVITSPAAAHGVVGESFGYTLHAETSRSFAASFPRQSLLLRAGPLPPGLVFRPDPYGWSSFSYGRISGTPTTAGTYRVPVSATAHGVTTDATLTIVVAEQSSTPPVITSASVELGNVGVSLSYTLAASNAATVFEVSNLPAGLSFNPETRSISGKPTDAGVFVVDVAATNPLGTGTAKITFVIDEAPKVTFSESASVEGHVGKSFSSYITGSNPLGDTVVYSATNLPPGLEVSASTISGTPTAAGVFPVTITARNGAGVSQMTQNIVIRAKPVPPTITSPISATGHVGKSFSYSIFANGGTTSFGASSLPPGFTVSNGTISGTPSAVGPHEVRLVANNEGGSASAVLTLHVDSRPPPPKWTSAATSRAYAGHPMTFSFTATGEITAYHLSGTLPPGVTFDAPNRRISGTPSQVGVFPLQITAVGPGGSTIAPFTLFVSNDLPLPVITSPFVGFSSLVPYSNTYQIRATNSPSFYSAGRLPAGMVFNSQTGIISSRTPNFPGSASDAVVVTATNATGTSTATVTFHSNRYGGYPSYNSFGPAMALAAVGAPFAYRLDPFRAGGYSSSYFATGLPEGLTMAPDTGEISGTPTTPGVYAVKVSISRGLSYPDSPIEGTVTLVVEDHPEPPLITSPGLLQGAVGAEFAGTISAPNAAGFAVDMLPAGLTLNPSTGAITGTPTSAGRNAIKASATNAGGTTTCDLVINVAAAPEKPVFTGDAGARGYLGTNFSYSASASNHPSRYEADGLPAGLAIDSRTGVIGGTPAQTGRFVVTLRAINAGGTGTAKLTLDITAPETPIISSNAVVSGTVGNAISYTINGSNSPNAFDASGLPPGLTVNPNTGAITGIPTSAGVHTVQVSASNAGGTGNATVLFDIASGAPTTLYTAAGAAGLVGSPLNLYLSTSTSGVTYEAENLPPGLSLTDGAISGVPLQAGVWPVALRIRRGDRETPAIVSIRIDATPATPPIVTSPLTATMILGSDFHYTATASNLPDTISAIDVPEGFAYNDTTWTFSGFPDSSGSHTTEVRAQNSLGATTAQITFLAAWDEPAIVESSANVFAGVGRSLSHPVTLEKGAVDFPWTLGDAPPPTLAARGLPPGLYLNPSTQTIEGVATVSGIYPVTFLATDAFGNLTTTQVTYHISESERAAPSLKIASSTDLSAAGAVGSPFTLRVWPEGTATQVDVEGLSPGLRAESSTGMGNGYLTQYAEITGTPAKEGVYPITVTFTNGEETARAVVTIVIPHHPLPPHLSSNMVARGRVGRIFNYPLWDNTSHIHQNSPTAYSITQLPAGLVFDHEGKRITGMPSVAGRFQIPIKLTNTSGVTEALLSVTIDSVESDLPRLTGSGGVAGMQEETGTAAQSTGYAGETFRYTMRAADTVTNVTAAHLPAGLVLLKKSADLWVLEGVPSEAGTFEIVLSATNNHGMATVPLTLDIREFDSVENPPTPTPVPEREKRPRLVVRLPSVLETRRRSLPIRGAISPLTDGTRLEVRRAKEKWKAQSLSARGRFRFRVSALPQGRTRIAIRATSPSGRKSVRVIRIVRVGSPSA